MNASRKPAQPARIRLMSLNLRFGLAEDGPNHWRFRNRAYPALLNRYPCDFYLFQEANDFQDAPPIDWILYRGDLHVEYAQIVERSFDGVYPSDHFPLIAEFSWSQA